MFKLLSDNIEVYEKGIRISGLFFVPTNLLLSINENLRRNNYNEFIMDKYAFDVDRKKSTGHRIIYKMYNKENRCVFVSALDIIISSYILINKYTRDEMLLLDEDNYNLNYYKARNKLYIIDRMGEPLIGEFTLDDLELAMSGTSDFNLSVDSISYQNRFDYKDGIKCLRGSNIGWCTDNRGMLDLIGIIKERS